MKLSSFLVAFASTVSVCIAGAPSVYWDIPHYDNFTSIRQRIFVIEGKHTGFFYGTFFSFVSGAVASGFYIGLQPRTNSNNHITFSAFGEGATVWDTDRCGNGADSGPGISCAYDWPWQFNHTYFLEVTLAETSPEGNNTWVGTLVDNVSGYAVYIANFTTPADWGLIQGGTYSFDEIYATGGTLTTPIQHCLYYTSYNIYPPEFYYTTIGYAKPFENNVTGGILDIYNVNDTSHPNPCSPTNESGQRAYYIEGNGLRFENGIRGNY